MLNKELIIQYLKQYSEDEKIYKTYYELQEKPEELKQYLASLDPEFVRSHCLFMKEFPFIHIPDFMEFHNKKGPGYMYSEYPETVHIMKHLRYTPAFTHAHDYFEIVYMIYGSCHQTLDGEQLPLKEGDICFIPPYQKHTLEIFDDSIAINIMIQKENFEDILFSTLRSNTILSDFFMGHLYSKNPMQRLLFSTNSDESIREDIYEIFMETMVSDSYTQSIIQHMVPIFFTHVLRLYGKKVETFYKGENGQENALKMIRYAYDHYQSISLSELAQHFHYSEAHASRLIKKETGQNFTTLLRHIRMSHAEALLKESKTSIVQIAEIVGYENPETFIRAFKKDHQMTPAEYRKSN